MLDSIRIFFATAETVNNILSVPSCSSRFFPMGEALPKYFLAAFSVMTSELVVGKAFFASPSFSGKSKRLKKLLSTILTGSLKVLLLYFTGGLSDAILQLACTSGKPACRTGAKGMGVTVFV